MAETSIAQVLIKDDFSKQALVPFTDSPGSLGSDSVRVRTTVLGLSINNHAYAISGTVLGWWDTYPVPEKFPFPYNDRKTYGILSGWGYATVLESNTLIQPGTLIKGYFPISSIPVDLQLTPAKASGHWIEISAHRAKVMHLYQRYQVSKYSAANLTKGDLDSMALDVVVGVLWECSYLLNRFSFLGQSGTSPINPAGNKLPWTESEADLSQATVIFLAASGKTAMTMAYEMQHARSPGTGPLKLIGITGTENVSYVKISKYYTSVITYDEALADLNSLPNMVAQNSTRVVVVDFGARGTFTPQVHTALKSHSVPLTMIRVGFENKPYSPEEVMQVFGLGPRLGMVQMNTSPLREQAMAMIGEDRYFKEMSEAWSAFKSKGGIPGLKLKWSEGMRGANGLEGTWSRLCENVVVPEQAIVVKL